MTAAADAARRMLLDLNAQYRAQVETLVQQTEASLFYDWQRGMAAAPHLYQPLLDRYAAALNQLRLTSDDPAAALSLDWLTNQNPLLASIEQSVKASAEKYAQDAAVAVEHGQATSATLGEGMASELTQAALFPASEVGVDPAMLFNRPNPDAIASFVGRAGDGHPLGDLFSNFGAEATTEARKVLATGLLLGQNPLAMTAGLSQAMGISRSRAAIIARTEILGSYRDAAHETYRANSDVLGYWLWSAGGANPCAMCMGMDGTLHDLNESLDDHPCGKCAPLPVTKGWDDILGPLGIDSSGLEDTSLGVPGAYETGEEKFAKMSPEQQRAILGTNTGYEAYRRGEVTLRDFVGVRPAEHGFPSSYYQKSLKELQIPTRQARRLVEPRADLLEKYAAGKLRYSDLGKLTPDELMPAWAKQSESSRIVYQILRNGLPYDLTGHEQGLLIVNLEQMLKGELPLNVRAAAERQLLALGQSVERKTVGIAAKDLAERAFSPAANRVISPAEQEAKAEVRAAKSQISSLNRKLEKATLAGKDTTALEADLRTAGERLAAAQVRLDAEVAVRKAAQAGAKEIEKQAKAAERTAAREAAKQAKAAEREAAKQARLAEKQAAREGQAITSPAPTPEQPPTAQEVAEALLERQPNGLASFNPSDLGSASDIRRADEAHGFFGNAKHGYYEWRPIVTRLGARLADNPDVQQLARTIQQVAKAEGERFTPSVKNAIDFVLSQYHSTFAYEDNPFVIELQKAVAEEFGTAGRAYGNFSARSIAQADKVFGDALPGMRAVVRAMYDDTQRYFQEQGITEVDLYRGMKFASKTRPEGILWNGEAQQVQMELHAMSSFSISPTEAALYTEVEKGNSYIAVAGTRVPVERILSIPQTGFGSFSDHEVLVLGGRDTYAIIPKFVARATGDVYYTPDELYTKFGAVGEDASKAFATSIANANTPFGPLPVEASYDVTASDHIFLADLRQQIAQLDQNALSHDHALDIGGQINSRIVHDPSLDIYRQAAEDARAIRSVAQFSDLTPEQLAWVRGEPEALAAHGGVRVGVAEGTYRAEYQARAFSYLQELRAMGGTDLRLDAAAAAGFDERAAGVLNSVNDRLPRDWIEASNAHGELAVVRDRATNSGGWYQSSAGSDGNGTLAIHYSRNADEINLQSLALHEMMHRMEDVYPQIGQLEEAFYNSRTTGEEFVRLTNGISGKTKLDDWADQYIGREPYINRGPLYTSPSGIEVGYRYSYEIMSVGVEALLGGGSTWDLIALREDEDFMDFVMGVLATVGRS